MTPRPPAWYTALLIAVVLGLFTAGVWCMYAVSPWGTVIIFAGVAAVALLLWVGCRAANESDLPRPKRSPKDRLYLIREQTQREQADRFDRILDAAERRRERV